MLEALLDTSEQLDNVSLYVGIRCATRLISRRIEPGRDYDRERKRPGYIFRALAVHKTRGRV